MDWYHLLVLSDVAVNRVNVAFDLRSNWMAGVRRFALSIFDSLLALPGHQDLNLTVFHRPRQYEDLIAILNKYPDTNAELIPVHDDDKFLRRAEHVRRLLSDVGVDLYYTPHYLVDTRIPVPFVHTVHDLTRIRFPHMSYTDETFIAQYGQEEFDALVAGLDGLSAYDIGPSSTLDRSLFFRYFLAANRWMASKSVQIATVSHASARDIIRILHVPPSKVSVLPGGVSTDTFFPRSPDSVTEIRRKFSIPGPFCLFVGLGHPHKRLMWLLELLVNTRHLLPIDARFIVVGPHIEMFEPAKRAMATLDGPPFVQFLSGVDDEELAPLYTGAAALVSASVNEGGNLPPLEALACGTEVIAPRIEPLEETLGEHAHFYDIHDPHHLASLLLSAYRGTLPSRSNGFQVPRWGLGASRLLHLLLATARDRDKLAGASTTSPRAPVMNGHARLI